MDLNALNSSVHKQTSESGPKPYVSTWSYTSSKLIKYETILVVDNFAGLVEGRQSREVLTTLDIQIPNRPQFKWQMALFWKDCLDATKQHLASTKYIDIIVCLERGPAKLWKTAALSVLDAAEQKCITRKYPPFLEAATNKLKYIGQRVTEARLRELTSDGKLTIAVEIVLEEDSVVLHASRYERLEAHVDLVQDFGSILNDQTLTDVVLNVDGHQLHAHRTILAARSPVFAAMFESNLSECKDGVVFIADMSKEVFELVLQFVYTDKVPEMKDNAALVLAAADKYDLTKLKALAQTELCSNISCENVCDILSVADTHNAPYLKERALRYITSSSLAVIKTDGWRSLVKNYPHLCAEAFEYLARKK